MAVPESRSYSGTHDLECMLDVLASTRRPERISDSPSPVDLRELLAMEAVRANTRLWCDSTGTVVAFALVDPYNNLRFEVRPRSATLELEAQLVAWGMECLRLTVPGNLEGQTLDASCREDDQERIALLKRRGFVRQAIRSLQLERSLALPIPVPELPPGFQIRPIAGPQEVGELVALHRAAFGTDHMTTEERLAMMGGPEYEAALDLLAVAPGGQIVAYCMCSISREENRLTGRNEGYTDPMATRPEFQRLGLAKGLLLVGLHALRDRGVCTAVLGTSSENTAMLQTAMAVGFRVRSATVWFAKAIPTNKPAG